MEESDSKDREGRDEISLLAEKLIQLSVKGSMVVPNSKPTLICTVWIEKLYNPESFRAQMKSIWKTRKKFEIQMVEQNLFLIVFDLEEELETIMKGRPCHFRKSIILFDRLIQAVERDQIRLNSSPFWIKIDSYLLEFNKKDLLHVIGVTFGGFSDLKLTKSVVGSESPWMFENHFTEYENLSIFCFGCGRMGHGIKDCTQIIPARKTKISVDPPYTLTLKAESKSAGKESMKFNAMMKNVGVQSSYTGGKVVLAESSRIIEKENNEIRGAQENIELIGGEEMIKDQGCIYRIEEVEKLNDSTVQECKNANPEKKTSWKRIKPVATVIQTKAENSTRKRKSPEEDLARSDKEDFDVDGTKRLKQDDFEGYEKAFSEVMLDSSEQLDIKNFLRSVATKRQADRTQ
ncbi:hypothetical protein Goshw_005141 [Gossypium schwendimanii]|uniref:CCHC-type domain-containing protein n=2 Tax=Gossypium schwendimanii TaxID=34291 RepID=A0A7J9MRZ4_GOSSC|nr:hypothetical protein [Gossypium schwendimanii]